MVNMLRLVVPRFPLQRTRFITRKASQFPYPGTSHTSLASHLTSSGPLGKSTLGTSTSRVPSDQWSVYLSCKALSTLVAGNLVRSTACWN